MFSDSNQTLLSTEDTDYTFDVVTEGNKKQFICKHRGCGKIFKYKSEVERHITIHSASRPFRCHFENCIKSFKRNDALDNHIRCSHTKETPFTCTSPDCGMKFASHGSFRYHLQKHHKQSPEETLTPIQENPSQPSKQVKLDTPLETVVSFPQSPQSAENIDPVYQSQTNSVPEFLVSSPPKSINSVQWEANNEGTEGLVESHKTGETEQRPKIEEENKILKQKLIASGKMIKDMQKQMNDLISTLFACQSKTEIYPSHLDSQKLPEKPETPVFDMINFDEEMPFSFYDSMAESQSSPVKSVFPVRDTFEFKR